MSSEDKDVQYLICKFLEYEKQSNEAYKRVQEAISDNSKFKIDVYKAWAEYHMYQSMSFQTKAQWLELEETHKRYEERLAKAAAAKIERS